MPIITFSEKDVMMNKVIDGGWYGARITKVEGPVAAATKPGKAPSYNYVVFVELDEKSLAPGKEFQCYFNTKLMGKMLPVFAAAKGVTLEDAASQENDTDTLVESKIDVEVVPDVYNGQPSNRINNWLPFGKGTQSNF